MPLIATRQLKMGFVVAANPGNAVAPEAVEQWGWQDGVEEVDDDGEAVTAAPARGRTTAPVASE